MKKALCLLLSIICLFSCFGVFAFAEDTACEHSYSTTVVAPSCAEQGYTLYVCGKCGDYYKADFKEARGHIYNEWYEVYPASCTQEGLSQHECINCKAAETKTIAVLAHVDANYDGKCDFCDKEMETKTETSPFDWLVAFFKAVINWFREIFA